MPPKRYVPDLLRETRAGRRHAGVALLALVFVPTAGRAGEKSWPMFRGNPQLTGVTDAALPEALVVRWKFETGDAVPGPVVQRHA